MRLPTPIQLFLQSLGWYGDQVLLAVEIQPDKEEYSCLVLEKQGEQIRILHSSRQLDQLELREELAKQPYLPIIVGIQQPGAVEAMVSIEEKEVLQAVLGVSVGDKNSFVHQELPASKGKKLASLIRKQHLEEWLVPLESVKDRIIFLNISPGSLAFLLPGMNQYRSNQAYYWPEQWSSYLWNQGLESVNGQNKQVINAEEMADGLQLGREDLFLFGTGVQYYLSNGRPLSGWTSSWQNRERIHKRHRLLNILGLLLPILLGLSLIIGLSANVLESRNEQARMELLSNRQIIDSIRWQQEEIISQSRFLNRASQEVLAPTQVSNLLDQVAQSRPQGMSFRNITLSPTQKEWEKITGEQGLEPPPVFLIGEAIEGNAIAAFAQSIQNIDLIQSAYLYQTEFDFQDQVHTFIITIHLSK